MLPIRHHRASALGMHRAQHVLLQDAIISKRLDQLLIRRLSRYLRRLHCFWRQPERGSRCPHHRAHRPITSTTTFMLEIVIESMTTPTPVDSQSASSEPIEPVLGTSTSITTTGVISIPTLQPISSAITSSDPLESEPAESSDRQEYGSSSSPPDPLLLTLFILCFYFVLRLSFVPWLSSVFWLPVL